MGLRNRINVSLIDLFGMAWWQSDGFEKIADDERRSDLDVVFRRIQNRGLKLENGQVVAGLSFGFWVGLLQPRIQPAIWGSHLRVSFPDLPSGKSRKVLGKRTGEIAYFRNRISHHEPILKRDITKDYAQMMEFLSG